MPISDTGTRKLVYPLTETYEQTAITPDDGTPLETISGFPPDNTEQTDIVLKLSLDEYVALATAIDVGRDIAFADDSELIWWIWNRAFRGNAQDFVDYCRDIMPDSSVISYLPQNPFTAPETVPTGYLLPPFWIVGDFLPEFIPDWFADLIIDAVTEFTNYEATDVLTTIGNFPLFGNWQTLLEGNYPRIEIAFTGTGTMELHLLSVPYGGTCLITLDDPASVDDLITGLWNDSDYLIELERDLSQIPPEIYPVQIIEYPVETTGDHIIYITFIPSVDATLVPLRFGGGLRKAVWCSDNVPDEPSGDCDIETLLADDEFFDTEYIPTTLGALYTDTIAHNEALETAYDGSTPQSIAPLIPTIAPDDEDKNALCAAVVAFVNLYCANKSLMLQSKHWIEKTWDSVNNAVEVAFEGTGKFLLGMLGTEFITCTVSVTDALNALANTEAIEAVVCALYEALNSDAMSKTLFDNAVTDLATTLTDDEQVIACLLYEDNILSIYLNFLEIYNIKLQAIADGDLLECPCETTSYRVWSWDFSNGLGEFGLVAGILSGGRLTNPTPTATNDIHAILPLNPAWRIHAAKVYGERINGITHGSQDVTTCSWRDIIQSTSGADGFPQGGALPNGVFERCGTYAPVPYYVTDKVELSLQVGVSNNGGLGQIYVDRIEIQFIEGYAKGGYLTDVELC